MWRTLAERELPELDRLIADAQTLRDTVADFLTCGCMNFHSSGLLADDGAE